MATLLLVGVVRRAEGENEVIPIRQPEPRLLAIAAPVMLHTIESPPGDSSRVRSSMPKAPVKLAARRTGATVRGNCVATLKAAGALPDKPVTKDGFARTIPTKPVELKPGMERVIKTSEGPVGHVLKVKVNEHGQAISTVEGGYPGGVGRVVNPAVIKGEVDFTKL